MILLTVGTATAAGGTHPTGMHSCYRPLTKFAKVMFLQVSVCPNGGGHAWFYLGGAWFYLGGMHGFIWGEGGMHGFIWGQGCMVLFWGACMVLFGGHA